MSVNPVFPVVFNGGQMTDLPVFSGTLDGTELMEIVAAGAGQDIEANGVNYQITTLLLATLLVQVTLNAVIIGDGEHTSALDPYEVQPTDGRIYINKSIASPTYILMPLASTMVVEPLVQDIAGTVTDVNGVTVAFTGGELANGLATIPIQSAYGGYFFRPATTLGKWLLGSA